MLLAFAALMYVLSTFSWGIGRYCQQQINCPVGLDYLNCTISSNAKYIGCMMMSGLVEDALSAVFFYGATLAVLYAIYIWYKATKNKRL